MESEEREEWEEELSAGRPVGGFARQRPFSLIGSATMLENTGGAKAGEFFDEVVMELSWVLLLFAGQAGSLCIFVLTGHQLCHSFLLPLTVKKCGVGG